MIVSPAPYLPFMDPVAGRVPGLQPLDPATWTERDAAFAEQMAYRDRLIAERPDRVALSLPEITAAVAELAAILRGHLDYPVEDGMLRRPDRTAVPVADDIATLGRLCQEDWVLLDKPDGWDEYRLAGANLCFPSGWDLRDKIGKPLTRVHDPVPEYAPDLSRRVNRIFEALQPDRPLWRLNYSATGTAELHCPTMDLHQSDAPERFLRVERQTLRRLPETGAVVFGIKLYITPVTDLTPPQYQAFHAALAAFSPAMADYKGGADYLTRTG